jgi:hypothetical protein
MYILALRWQLRAQMKRSKNSQHLQMQQTLAITHSKKAQNTNHLQIKAQIDHLQLNLPPQNCNFIADQTTNSANPLILKIPIQPARSVQKFEEVATP